jgi:uncharacterized protein YecE (DUF72 family)
VKTRQRDIFIGTSGWSYASWRGPFFPKVLPSRLHLQFYASQFGSTELNGVFYRTPTEEAVRTWAEQTPEDFVFAWKASKFITHWKRLNQTSVNSIALLESRLRLLGKKVGPVLFQLPPQSQKDHSRIEGLLKLLPSAGATPSIAIPIGTKTTFLTCCRTMTLHSVFQIITMLHRRGLPRLVSFM